MFGPRSSRAVRPVRFTSCRDPCDYDCRSGVTLEPPGEREVRQLAAFLSPDALKGGVSARCQSRPIRAVVFGK